MDPVTIGGLASSAVVVTGGLWKIRKEARELTAQRDRDRAELDTSKRKAEVEARSAAVDAAESAVGVVKSAMETQGETVTSLQRRVDDQGVRLTDSERQITRQAERITDLDLRHGVAVSHIAEREDAADEHLGPTRPAWLPPIPDLIRPDVDAARRPH
ncbi:hypothetical protein [Corynebacterium variabile]|uniref:hypothetical protein n=1 Tax=Corynebacterium variabile TaxID=1727 RepID=UPI003F921AE1